ncbi:hypothetical protein ACUY2P_11640 [Corynebacterium hadale]
MSVDTQDKPVTFKVELRNDANVGPLYRIGVAVKTKNLVDLISIEDLAANPRRPKRTTITEDIMQTIQTAPEMLPFYSKGILIGSSDVVERDRDRFQLHFADPDREGVLGGGHNLMAIALVLLGEVGVSEKALRKVKFWDQFKEVWAEHTAALKALRQDTSPTLDALVPLEIIAPLAGPEVGDGLAEFNNLIMGICANRNQNAQLAADAIANKSGVFDFLKESMPAELADQVTWSTNDNKRIDPRMLVSLLWVSLGKVPTLGNYGIKPITPTSAYSSKAASLQRFTDLVEADGAAEKTDDGKSYVVLDGYIYTGFKDAYNENGGSFGRIGAVKKTSKGANRTLVTNQLVEHEVPPSGYLIPLLFSIQALIKDDAEAGRLTWHKPPLEFLQAPGNLTKLVGALKPIIEMANWNPQTVGKNSASYEVTYAKLRELLFDDLLG